MKIRNIDGLSASDLQKATGNGARFVYYSFTISLLILTLKRTSDVYLIQPQENSVRKGIPFTLLTLLLGWWGIPYGPRFTLESLRKNLRGGTDVTDEVMSTVAGHILFVESQHNH